MNRFINMYRPGIISGLVLFLYETNESAY